MHAHLAFLFLYSPAALLAQTPEKYRDAIRAIETLVERERQDAGIPGLAMALVDDQTLVWAKGFGHADHAMKKPVTPETVFRVGPLSQSMTALVAMQLVEEGKLDLDAPVTKYLPDFKPINPSGKPITTRQLLAHRSGLVREPLAGSCFDSTHPSLETTVASLNGVPLLFEPGTKTKYSNAGIAVVGRIIEKIEARPFATSARDRILTPLGMTSSSFELTPEVKKNLAEGFVATFHGRETPDAAIDLGESPALGLYSSVADVARFMSALLAGSNGPKGRLVKSETLYAMLTPTVDQGYGFGFLPDGSPSNRWVTGSGCVRGYSTEFVVHIRDKLAVVMIANREIAESQNRWIANTLRCYAAVVKGGKRYDTLKVDLPQATPSRDARMLTGKYGQGPTHELFEATGRLYHWPSQGGRLSEIRITDHDALVHGIGPDDSRFESEGQMLKIDPPDEKFHRRIAISGQAPSVPPEELLGLIGEYGTDENSIQVFEKDGKLHLLIQGFYFYPLEVEKVDVYRFPTSDGRYDGEKLVFMRESGKATLVTLSGIRFPRRKLDGEDGQTFRIKPLRPVDELRKEAMAAAPPEDRGDFRKADLVELTALDPDIKTDLRYASDNNFMGTPLYPKTARAYMQRPAAEALVRANKALAENGYGLWIFDAYRPWAVTKMFWEATPEKMRMFVADPSKGSRHNRGCAVDLSLYDRKTGRPVEMVSGFDEFSDRAYPNYWGGTSRQRWHRQLLRWSMEDQGFTVYEAEWWHFDFKDWKSYRIGNESFEQLTQRRKDAK